MVPKNSILFVFHGDGQDWELVEERKPPLKKEQIADWDDGFYKIEIRNPSSNRFIYPNVLYMEVANGEIVRKSIGKPFKIYDEPETPATVESPPQTNQFTGMEVIAKVLEQQTAILTTLMQMITQNQNRKDEDSGMKDIVELYKLKMLKKLEKELLQEDEQEQIIQMTPEERQMVDTIYAHLGQGQIGTAIVLWNQLKEKNEPLAQTVMANILDMAMNGQLDLSAIFGQQGGQNNAGNNA